MDQIPLSPYKIPRNEHQRELAGINLAITANLAGAATIDADTKSHLPSNPTKGTGEDSEAY